MKKDIPVIKAPDRLPLTRVKGILPGSVFLAGSIEMGAAENWQDKLIDGLNYGGHGVHYILNPRRDDWDSSWEQKKSNPNFREQVEWELHALDAAEWIFMYFDPNTKSPISLLELGLYASSGKLVVSCPGGFWRKGNVDIVCERYGIKQSYDIDSIVKWLKNGITWKEICRKK